MNFIFLDIGEAANKYMEKEKIKYFDNQEELINNLLENIETGDLVYLKASKAMDFYNIVNKLQKI